MPATSSRACSTADRDHRPDDADALAQATDDQVGLTSGELAHLVLVDASSRPHGDRLAAGQLLVVDLPGPLGHPIRSRPGRPAAASGTGRMQLAAASSRSRSSSLPSATLDWPARTTPVPAVRVAGSTPPRAATAPRRPPAAHVRPISSTARAPVTPPAAAKRPRDTQPTRTTQAPATQPAMPAGRPGAGSGRRAGSRRAVGRG